MYYVERSTYPMYSILLELYHQGRVRVSIKFKDDADTSFITSCVHLHTWLSRTSSPRESEYDPERLSHDRDVGSWMQWCDARSIDRSGPDRRCGVHGCTNRRIARERAHSTYIIAGVRGFLPSFFCFFVLPRGFGCSGPRMEAFK